MTRIWICLILLFLLIRFSGKLRLTIPLWYVFLVPTIFHKWYDTHELFANGIWFGMLALVALSWVLTLAKRIRN